MSLLEISGLRVSTATQELVHGIDLTIDKGEWLAVIGESGSGKSVSAFSIADLLPRGLTRTADRLMFDGADLLTLSKAGYRELRGNRIAYVFQDYQQAFSPYYRIGKQLDEVLKAHTDWKPERRREHAAATLERLSLPGDLLHRYPFQVSGGQLQRAALAAAILLDPALIIADEPTTALDAVNASLVLDQLADIQKEKGCSVLFITHNLRLAGKFADTMAIMQDGCVKERGTVSDIFTAPKAAITRNLIAAIPPLRNIPARLPVALEGVA
ncbi:ATP-binding cassette domain-containing protein [Tessaracoccus palaemonis]|uniref:ABC transporter ATP-binding protein n=1 Tax=Tessaracoccus palaemonis TaxID=2829499 RepID=A0ABX8SJM3_9ACTN|nr:ABC transporter ATP-binding protein [Tessaracoccus palaemonis]QXT63576.1 ABC transporter ATP-binding protein [Tessaracoccus palaemonis]